MALSLPPRALTFACVMTASSPRADPAGARPFTAFPLPPLGPLSSEGAVPEEAAALPPPPLPPIAVAPAPPTCWALPLPAAPPPPPPLRAQLNARTSNSRAVRSLPAERRREVGRRGGSFCYRQRAKRKPGCQPSSRGGSRVQYTTIFWHLPSKGERPASVQEGLCPWATPLTSKAP